MVIRKAGLLLGLLAAAALPLLAVPSAAKTAAKTAEKTTAKTPAVAAKPATDDPDFAVDTISPPSQGALAAAGWRIIDDLVTGARLGLPSALVPKTAPARMGSRWTSRGGSNRHRNISPARGRAAGFVRRRKESAPSHRRAFDAHGRPLCHVGNAGPETVHRPRPVERRRAARRHHSVRSSYRRRHGADPATMANTYQGFPDPSAAAPPGLRRSVDYGTAIVVSAQGHLITSAQITDGCQVIAIPGFGHAERVAADKANDIELLRVYGAQNLCPRRSPATTARAMTLPLSASPIRWPRPAAPRSRARRRIGARKISTRRQSSVSPARRRSIRKAASPAWWI